MTRKRQKRRVNGDRYAVQLGTLVLLAAALVHSCVDQSFFISTFQGTVVFQLSLPLAYARNN